MKKSCLLMVAVLAVSVAFVAHAATYSSKLVKGPWLTYQGDPTTMRVMWDSNGTNGGSVDWGTTTSYSGGNSPAVTGAENVNQCDLTGLPPGTKIYYRVNVGGTTATSFFYSAPAESATTCTFYAGGDSRTNPDKEDVVFGRMLTDANANESVRNSLLIFASDFVQTGGDESKWQNDYFSTSYANSRLAQSRFPIQPSVGNHECYSDPTASRMRMYMPMNWADGNNGATTANYVFDYGPVRILVLDSERSVDSGGAAQLSWAINQMQNNTKPFLMALYHQPAYSAGGHADSEAEMSKMRSDYTPQFINYGCKLIFNGHNHYYNHSLVNGIHHITTGGFGAGESSTGGAVGQVIADSDRHVCRVDCDASTGIAHVTVLRELGGEIENFDVSYPILNQPPEVTSTPDLYTDVAATYNYTLTATDPESDPITFIEDSIPGWLTFTPGSGLLTGVPSAGDIGPNLVQLDVSDGTMTTDHDFTINVSAAGNDAPVVTSDPVQVAAVGEAYSYTLTAMDPDGDNITLIETSVPAWLSLNTGTGVLTGTPVASGVDLVTLSVSDGTVTVDQIFNIGVFATVPSPNLVQNFSFENGMTSWTGSGSGTDTTADSQEGGSSMVLSASSSPAQQAVTVESGITYNLSVWVNASAVTASPWVFDTADEYDTTCQFALGGNSGWQEYTGSFTALDNSVTLRMFTEASFVGTVYFDNISLTSGSSENIAPMIISTPVTSVDKDAAYSYTMLAVDIEDDPLTYSQVTVPGWASFAAGTGILSGTPTAAGDYPVELSVTDGALSTNQSFTITVNQTQVSVPDVVGKSQSSAEADIVAAGLSVGTVTTENSDTVPVGDVISQNPGSGSQVDPGTSVDLVVSDGPALTGYEAWQVDQGVDDNVDTDPDGDGCNNFYEYVLGGDPGVAGDEIDPAFVKATDSFEYSFKQRNDDPSLTYTVEICTDLAAGSWSTASTTAGTNVIGGAYDDVTHTIQPDQSQSYIRLKVQN